MYINHSILSKMMMLSPNLTSDFIFKIFRVLYEELPDVLCYKIVTFIDMILLKNLPIDLWRPPTQKQMADLSFLGLVHPRPITIGRNWYFRLHFRSETSTSGFTSGLKIIGKNSDKKSDGGSAMSNGL